MKVYYSAPRRTWRVEQADNGRVRVYRWNPETRTHTLFKRFASVTAAAEWLAGRGVTELVED